MFAMKFSIHLSDWALLLLFNFLSLCTMVFSQPPAGGPAVAAGGAAAGAVAAAAAAAAALAALLQMFQNSRVIADISSTLLHPRPRPNPAPILSADADIIAYINRTIPAARRAEDLHYQDGTSYNSAILTMAYIYESLCSQPIPNNSKFKNKKFTGKTGARVESTYKDFMHGFAPFLIKCFILGPGTPSGTLGAVRTDDPELFDNYVDPCIDMFLNCGALSNPKIELKKSAMLAFNITTFQATWRKKVNTYGIWDGAFVMHRALKPGKRADDNDLLKGLWFPFFLAMDKIDNTIFAAVNPERVFIRAQENTNDYWEDHCATRVPYAMLNA